MEKLKTIWNWRGEILLGALFIPSMLLEWAAANRVGLLPRQVAWLPDLLIGAAIVLLALTLLKEKNIRVERNLLVVLAGLAMLALISAFWNRQPLLNFLYGAWLYFRYIFLILLLCLVPLCIDLTRTAMPLLLAVGFLQIPLAIVQKYVFQLDRDLVTGTMIGAQRLALICVVLFCYLFSLGIFKKKAWLGYFGLLFLIPTAMGESKAFFFAFPVVVILLLFLLRQRISLRFALATAAICLVAGFTSLFLFPESAQKILLSWLKNPDQFISDQDRYSKLRGTKNDDFAFILPEDIPESAYNDPEELIEKSEGRRLGRLADLRFSVKNTESLSKGGWLLGGGIGSTAEVFFAQSSGLIFQQYPTLDLGQTPLAMIFLELGIPGLLVFLALGMVIFLRVLRFYQSPRNGEWFTGMIGFGLILSLGLGFVYTNFFQSISYMFVFSVVMAILFRPGSLRGGGTA